MRRGLDTEIKIYKPTARGFQNSAQIFSCQNINNISSIIHQR